MGDVGKYKADVAAARIMERIPGVTVTPHCCMIQEKPLDFYEQFHVIVLGLDSLEARRYMNSVACSFLGACVQIGGVWREGKKHD
jgi:ubiquitin-activating enzyme E1 C